MSDSAQIRCRQHFPQLAFMMFQAMFALYPGFHYCAVRREFHLDFNYFYLLWDDFIYIRLPTGFGDGWWLHGSRGLDFAGGTCAYSAGLPVFVLRCCWWEMLGNQTNIQHAIMFLCIFGGGIVMVWLVWV